MALVLALCINLYRIFNLRLFLSIPFLYIKKKSGIETPDRNGQWYHLLTLLAFFMRAIPKGQTFGICLKCVLRLKALR